MDAGARPASQGLQEQANPESLARVTTEGLSLTKPVCKKYKYLLFQMCKHQCRNTKIITNQGNMTLSKEQNKVPITNPEEMEIYKLPDKVSVFKITI